MRIEICIAKEKFQKTLFLPCKGKCYTAQTSDMTMLM